MMHGQQRQVQGIRQRLGGGHADQQRSQQAGPVRHGDGAEIAEADARLCERFGDDGVDLGDMLTRRDFRHDAAGLRVQVNLRRNHIGAQLASVPQHCRRGLIAGRFNS